MSCSRMSRGKSRSMSGTERKLLVQEAAEKEAVLEGADVGEADQVADDAADRGAGAAAGRQLEAPARPPAAYLRRDLLGELEQVAVDEEEAGEVVVTHE